MVKSLHTRWSLGEKSRGVVFASYPWSSFWPPTVGCCIHVEAAVEHICARGPGATAVGHIKRRIKKQHGVQVFVRDNNVDQALKALKRKMQREGVFREMKLRKHYEKSSERKVREQSEAIRRARKLAPQKTAAGGFVTANETPAGRGRRGKRKLVADPSLLIWPR
jgi:small subunit ribosomal protein S21